MQGIYLPLMTPFKLNGEIDFGCLEAMFEHHIRQGVHGFYVGGSSSECFMMSIKERQWLLGEIAKINRGRVPLIAHVGAISLFEVKQLIDSAVAAEYSAISATPPFYYGFSKAEVGHFYRSIAEYSLVPLLLYNIPGTTGVNFTHQELFELSELPNVIGLKHTTSDMFFIEQLRQRFADSVIFHGEDTMLVNGLQMGASGGIGSTYNLMSADYVAMFEAMQNGDTETAMALQRKVNSVTAELLKHGVYQSIKFLMHEKGVNYGHCREPFLPLSNQQKGLLARVLDDIYFK
ncbi:N-acetylneuraminate lyase [Vibrio ponticus]|uniref:N-acetylneuraminate lyase n=1 Tax=Vibrio ponticus TaxID=265668 RepID=A0A3N3DSJ8_9VIBR|nr:N-acetylneuraminate lyase [Vibrio ponticus]ROV57481.1 N-acetylneuraminate lyase [Vibrio ponticus]